MSDNFRRRAQRAHARRLEQARDTARDDQRGAAEQELVAWFTGIAAVGQALGVYGPVHSAKAEPELHRRIKAGLDRRIYTWCKHLRADAPRPAFVSLSHGEIVCKACSPELLSKPIDDDGRCDLCDRETRWFHELAVVADLGAGPAVIVANVCDRCRALAGTPGEVAA